ncbi:MAG: PaaI family thioesterase [Desulfarculales bacterium]|jgi:acyl-CoA thioesterase|nr:PaaI family thioesterase [Desulfarculales bacterium]
MSNYALEKVSNDPVARMLGIKLKKLDSEGAVVELVPEPRHLNALGVVHGTIIYALVDQASAIACNAFDYKAILCQGKVDFLNTGAADNKLYAVARPVSIKRRLSIWDVKVSDENGVLIASGQTMAYHFVG